MSLASCEYRQFQFGETKVLLDVRRNMLYQVDEIAWRILGLLSARGGENHEEIPDFEGGNLPHEADEALGELKKLGLVSDGHQEAPVPEPPRLPPIQTLCLHLVHRCTLRCTYCYGRGGDYGTPGESMAYSTAVEAVEFLLDQLPLETKGQISFFGGEPLLHWDLLRRVIPYIRRREKQEGRQMTLHLTTNGTLLTDEIVGFLHLHRVKITVSLDGPPEVHNRMRVFPDGGGSYHHVLPGIERLLRGGHACFMRATLNPVEPRLHEVVEHLLHVGAAFVHTEPASGLLQGEEGKLHPEGLKCLKEAYGHFKKRYIHAIEKEARLLPFFAFVRILRMLTGSGGRREYGCGMGRSYLALSPQGVFYPCHRFVDEERYRLGDLHRGLLPEARQRFARLHVQKREPCQHCWARYLCGGGCYYDAAVINGGFEKPDPTHCELTKHIITEAIEIATHLSHIPSRTITAMVQRSAETVSYL